MKKYKFEPLSDKRIVIDEDTYNDCDDVTMIMRNSKKEFDCKLLIMKDIKGNKYWLLVPETSFEIIEEITNET